MTLFDDCANASKTQHSETGFENHFVTSRPNRVGLQVETKQIPPRNTWMHSTARRFVFADEVPFEDVEASLLLAIWATESLHGSERVRMDAGHFLDTDARTVVVAADTDAGRDLCKVFLGFLRREFGEDAFRIERNNQPNPRHPLNERTATACHS